MRLSLLALLALAAFAACRHPEAKPDYDSVRQREAGAHQELDNQGK